VVTVRGGHIVVPHRVALDCIPNPHVAKEQLAVGEGARARVPHADLPAGQIPDTPDPRSLAHHQLSRRSVQVRHRQHVFVLAGVVLQAAIAPQVDVPGVDHSELHPAPIDLAQVLQRAGRGLGLDGVVGRRLDGAEGLNGIGHDLKGAARRTAPKHHALAARGGGGQGDGQGQQRRADNQEDLAANVHSALQGPG